MYRAAAGFLLRIAMCHLTLRNRLRYSNFTKTRLFYFPGDTMHNAQDTVPVADNIADEKKLLELNIVEQEQVSGGALDSNPYG